MTLADRQLCQRSHHFFGMAELISEYLGRLE
ncbi:hypothetical protein T11_12838 [Trichinella zimbabwensis]|uniref:Uncharacterized protein n=1 Tax=Trichinella zimbabwensis TaxID=268475 RepID=A0A0V1GJS4_9BILA|nr:hypothetical protein T11_12838 [Trichinella zimbabwensis]